MDADIRALERQDWRLAIRSPRAGGRMTKWLNPFQTKEQRRKVINHILLRTANEPERAILKSVRDEDPTGRMWVRSDGMMGLYSQPAPPGDGMFDVD
jgi:hypothetical protein